MEKYFPQDLKSCIIQPSYVMDEVACKRRQLHRKTSVLNLEISSSAQVSSHSYENLNPQQSSHQRQLSLTSEPVDTGTTTDGHGECNHFFFNS